MIDQKLMRRLTVADCDAILLKASEKIKNLQFKKAKLVHRLDVHYRIVSRATEEIGRLRSEISFQESRLSQINEEERKARECRCKITQAQGRILQLELRLEDYSLTAGADKESDLDIVNDMLEHAALFIAEYETHRAGLLRAAVPPQPEVPAEPEPAAVISPGPAQEPVGELKPVAGLEPLARIFHKQKGRRLVKTKQVMKRAG